MRRSRVTKALSLVNLFALTLAMLLPLTARPVMAQATTGVIRGSVTDPNGAPVVDATVTARNQATNVETAPFKTTGEGIYDIPGLPPGRYTVTIESGGFSRHVTTDVNVNIGVTTTVDVALQPGAVTETVTVVAGTEEVVNREQSQISATFETRRVEELPSNAAGSGLDTLALLTPGVVVGGAGVTNTNGTDLSVNGNRARSNNFQIDGSDNNDLSIGGPSYFVDNQDQVAEYQIITNNFSAQYGRNQGAVVNVVTKSGTNEFHGSAFEFHRNRSALDTMNNIERRDPGRDRADKFISNVFGGTFGGPIVRDRAFFFGSYQGIKQRQTTTARSTAPAIVPEEFARLQTTFPNNNAIQAITNLSAFALTSLGTIRPRTDLGEAVSTCVQPVRTVLQDGTVIPARSLVSCATPGSQGPFLVGGAFDVVAIGPAASPTLFQAAVPERIFATPFDQQEFSIRTDFKVTDRDNFYVRYLFQDSVSGNALGSSNGFFGDIPARTQNLGGSYTRQIGNTMVNEFRGVYQRLFVSFGGGCDVSTPGCIPGPNEIGTAVPDITFGGGLTGFVVNRNAGLRTIGGGTSFPQGRTVEVTQFADNLSWTRGAHSLIFGGEFKYLNNKVPFLPSYNGQFTFSGAAAGARLAANAPSAFSLAVGEPIITYTEYDQYYFFQDDWKVRDNLTLNLGIRYEYTGQPINDLAAIVREREESDNPLFNPALPLEARTLPLIPADKNNFAPRVGFAWTPRFWQGFFGEDATVIRGGYSIAYDPGFYNILLNVSNASPVSALLNIPAGLLPATNSPIPVPALGSLSGETIRQNANATGLLPRGQLNPQLLTQVPVGRDFHAPYSQQFSLGIQRQINRNNLFEARWVRTRGVGLFQQITRNPLIGTLANGFELDIPFENEEGFVTVDFPAFPQFLPPGATPNVSPDNPNTLDNEALANNRLIPGRGRILARENTAQSTYDGLQTRYSGRFFDNALSLGATYTFSKTLDNASEIFAVSENSPSPQNPFDYGRAERGRSAYDRPHVFTTNFLWDVPVYREQRGFVGHVLGGWQLNGTYVLSSGRTFTPSQFANASFLGSNFSYITDNAETLRPFIGNPNADARQVGISQIDAALIFGVPAADLNGFYSFNELNDTGTAVPVTPNDVRFIFNGPGAARIFNTPFGNVPRGYLRGPAINQLNLGLFKNTRITENVRLQFRAEAFNVLNHPQPGFGVVAADLIPDIYVEDAGNSEVGLFNRRDQMTLARRAVQFGLRLTF